MSNCSTIVCAVDFSEHSKVALHRAAAWSRHFRARLIVVTVVEPLLVNATAAVYDTDLVRSEVLPELRDFVDRTLLAGRTAIPPSEAMVLVGEPAAEIRRAGAEQTRTVDRHCYARLERLSQAAPGINSREGAPPDRCTCLLAPPPEQTPPNVDPSRIDVGRVLVPVDFKDGCCHGGARRSVSR